MNLKEHEDNRFTKEKTDLEKYLLRIIQRYFDIENNYTKESIEEMIIESLTRIKQSIIHMHGFIFSLNQRTGHIVLTIRDLGGQEAFDKNSAFNKDFGIDADTICEGNDPRLYDDREPLEHKHEIADVNGLKERLDKLIIGKPVHIHRNKDLLDIITYSGKQTEFDLILLEYLYQSLINYEKNLLYYQSEERVITKDGIETLNNCLEIIRQQLEYANSIVENAIYWIEDGLKYTDKKVSNFKNRFLQLLLQYVSKNDVQILMDHFNKVLYLTDEGEIKIPDGIFNLNPVIEAEEASSEDGDSLKAIYDEGLRFGNDDWQWDDINKSFVYQHNEEYSYPMFASLNKFNSYTHRVTLASDGGDNDCISVVIAYDEPTSNHLSLLFGNGGVRNDDILSGCAGGTIVLNYTGNYQLSGTFTIATKDYGPGKNWSQTPNGVTILIKKAGNNIKIWIKYDETHNWKPEERDGVKDIYPSETPDFDFNLTDYPELNMFVDKDNNYGYGCFSQPKSTYRDVYFISNNSVEPTGHTNIVEVSTIERTLNNSTNVDNGVIKSYFRYDKDSKTISVPIPCVFKTEDGSILAIQTKYTDNKLCIETNMINIINSYVTQDNFYENNKLIAISSKSYSAESLYDIPNLSIIDSASKNQVLKNILSNNRTCFFQGFLSMPDFLLVDNDGNLLSYTDWDINEPNTSNPMESNVYMNENKKWAIETDIYTKKRRVVLEYSVKRLSEYFDNPRIYYQVFGTKEV